MQLRGALLLACGCSALAAVVLFNWAPHDSGMPTQIASSSGAVEGVAEVDAVPEPENLAPQLPDSRRDTLSSTLFSADPGGFIQGEVDWFHENGSGNSLGPDGTLSGAVVFNGAAFNFVARAKQGILLDVKIPDYGESLVEGRPEPTGELELSNLRFVEDDGNMLCVWPDEPLRLGADGVIQAHLLASSGPVLRFVDPISGEELKGLCDFGVADTGSGAGSTAIPIVEERWLDGAQLIDSPHQATIEEQRRGIIVGGRDRRFTRVDGIQMSAAPLAIPIPSARTLRLLVTATGAPLLPGDHINVKTLQAGDGYFASVQIPLGAPSASRHSFSTLGWPIDPISLCADWCRSGNVIGSSLPTGAIPPDGEATLIAFDVQTPQVAV